MTTATVQLAFLRNDFTPAEVAAVEARILDFDREYTLHALRPQRCRCGARAYGEGQVCCRCGRSVRP